MVGTGDPNNEGLTRWVGNVTPRELRFHVIAACSESIRVALGFGVLLGLECLGRRRLIAGRDDS